MLFFKRILKEPEGGKTVPRKERRGPPRLPINAEFPLTAMLGFDRRGGTVAPMGRPGGSVWKGRLLDCSEVGARIVLGPAALASRDGFCQLRLGLDGFNLTVPCEVANLRVESDGVHFGLRHEFKDEAVRNAYRQLLEIIALGATLKPLRKTKPDDSGYLVEQYVGTQTRLMIWRERSDREVAAFEFLLKDCLVRAAREQPVQYLSGADATAAQPAPPAKALEIQRLFNWVMPNLAPAVPDDARNFLRHYTTERLKS